jgi:putative transposase
MGEHNESKPAGASKPTWTSALLFSKAVGLRRKGFRCRGYLPHVDEGGLTQFVTFRLGDALPGHVVGEMQEAVKGLQSGEVQQERFRQIEGWIDRGHGACWLRREDIGSVVEDALRYFDGKRYELHAWVVMPNHVHLLFTLVEGESLDKVMKSLKSFTARRCNKALGRSGNFWYREYFDRYIRNEKHFSDVVDYIEYNPVKAGLCTKPEHWKRSSAHHWTANVHGSADVHVGTNFRQSQPQQPNQRNTQSPPTTYESQRSKGFEVKEALPRYAVIADLEVGGPGSNNWFYPLAGGQTWI